MKTTDLRTKAYVLRRTNYGETDRILNLVTPNGKVSAIAKGARKEKSKLAGGIEMFSLIDANIHFGKTVSRDFGILTGTKMLKYHANLVKNLETLELASLMLKKIGRAIEGSDNPEYFQILDQGFNALDAGENRELTESWFTLNYVKATGEQINLYHDTKGERLDVAKSYEWDVVEKSLAPVAVGPIGADEIKLMRLMLSTNLEVVTRVKNLDNLLPKILMVARSFNV